MDDYITREKQRYMALARQITPDVRDWRAIWDRLAFAILSASAPFDRTVSALQHAVATRGHASVFTLRALGMVPRKAEYLDKLPHETLPVTHVRGGDETWNSYRLRLQNTVLGLGLTKASFAACLLYPLDADLACIDTWMQRAFMGTRGFQELSLTRYRVIERKVQAIARFHSIPTFVAQWLIWDHTRGKVTDHNVFPGRHK